jgi:hypothetical protein
MAKAFRKTAQRLGAAMAMAAVVGGCDDSGTSTPDAPSGPGLSSQEGTSQISRPAGITNCGGGSDTRSDLTCVDTNVRVDAVTPNASCDPSSITFLDGALTYPWGGAKVGAKSFTCNGCPNGLPELQGDFRAHGFVEDSDEPDYRYPDTKTDYAVVLKVDGNTFYTATYDARDKKAGETRGFYFCSMKPENNAKHLYWIDLDDNGAIINETRTDVVLTSGVDNLLLKFFNSATDTTDPTGFNYAFCRIGSSRGGQICNSPFLN